MPVNRSNVTHQVASELSEAIQNRRFRPGDKLPSVEKLAVELSVGRSTIREALRLLQAKGLIEIIHGAGTFVAQERIARTTGVVFSFSEVIRKRGMKPHSKVLRQDAITADEESAAGLNIPVGSKLNVLKRLRYADDLPMAVETSISEYARFPDILEQDWNGQASFYVFLRERYQVIPDTATQTVQAITAGRALGRVLQMPPKHPVLVVQTVAFDQAGIPIELGRSYYRADRFEYQVQLKNE